MWRGLAPGQSPGVPNYVGVVDTLDTGVCTHLFTIPPVPPQISCRSASGTPSPLLALACLQAFGRGPTAIVHGRRRERRALKDERAESICACSPVLLSLRFSGCASSRRLAPPLSSRRIRRWPRRCRRFATARSPLQMSSWASAGSSMRPQMWPQSASWRLRPRLSRRRVMRACWRWASPLVQTSVARGSSSGPRSRTTS